MPWWHDDDRGGAMKASPGDVQLYCIMFRIPVAMRSAKVVRVQLGGLLVGYPCPFLPRPVVLSVKACGHVFCLIQFLWSPMGHGLYITKFARPVRTVLQWLCTSLHVLPTLNVYFASWARDSLTGIQRFKVCEVAS